MKPVQFHPDAQTEFEAAQDYYESFVEGLGVDFSDEVRASVDIIQASPRRWSVRSHGTRQYLVHRFPFALVYLEQSDRIWIVAVAHLRRRPGYWMRRLR